MDRSETMKLMAIIRAAYPAFYKDAGAADRNAAVDLWQTMFASDSHAEVEAAVQSFIATDTKGFPPAIGAIKAKLSNLRAEANGEMTAEDAWALVRRALRNGIYGYREEYAKLPYVVQKCVGDAYTLHVWAQIDMATVESVHGSQFKKTFVARAGHIRDMQQAPANVRALYGQGTPRNAFALPAPAEEKPIDTYESQLDGMECVPAPEWLGDFRKKVERDALKALMEHTEAHMKGNGMLQ